jgi:hypothetical protein
MIQVTNESRARSNRIAPDGTALDAAPELAGSREACARTRQRSTGDQNHGPVETGGRPGGLLTRTDAESILYTDLCSVHRIFQRLPWRGIGV